MSYKTGTIIVEDAFGQRSSISLNQFGDAFEIGEIANLKEFIESMSDAKVVAGHVTESVTYDASGLFADATDKGKSESIFQRAVFIFKDADERGSFTFSIPAPKDEIFDESQQPKATYAKKVRDKIAELTSREASDLHYLGGGLRSRVPKAELRIKKI
jgi:hypothetical protein